MSTPLSRREQPQGAVHSGGERPWCLTRNMKLERGGKLQQLGDLRVSAVCVGSVCLQCTCHPRKLHNTQLSNGKALVLSLWRSVTIHEFCLYALTFMFG